MKFLWIAVVAGILAIGATMQALAWNPVTDVQEKLVWTLGQEASLGTAYKVAGSGPVAIGKRGDSAMLGVFDYRFIKVSYGAIRDSESGEKVGDGLKTGLMLNYFLGWFKSPQTPTMQVLQNVNIGPAVSIPLFTESKPFKYPSIWIEGNYKFGGGSTPTP
jgi:hypothetical protein